MVYVPTLFSFRLHCTKRVHDAIPKLSKLLPPRIELGISSLLKRRLNHLAMEACHRPNSKHIYKVYKKNTHVNQPKAPGTLRKATLPPCWLCWPYTHACALLLMPQAACYPSRANACRRQSQAFCACLIARDSAKVKRPEGQDHGLRRQTHSPQQTRSRKASHAPGQGR